jgi:hypothetical protein
VSIAPCPPSTPPTKGVVVFSPTAFKAGFPEFATVADAALNLSFSLATLQLNNSCSSRVCDANEREVLLNLLTAHITELKNGKNGQPPAGIVGRVSDAQEGSVRVSADAGTVVYGQAYYLQTQWGFLYWQSTAKYRSAVYVPAPPVCADFGVGALPVWPSWPGSGGCGC